MGLQFSWDERALYEWGLPIVKFTSLFFIIVERCALVQFRKSQERFQNHKNGQKSAWVVERYGLRLMPELFEYLNPMPFEAAAQMEKDLAEDLRAEGYTVAGGT